MSGSCSSAVEHSAKNQCIKLYGVPEREKQSDDILEIWKYEICIPKQRILVQRILCKYSGEKYKSNKGIYSESVRSRLKNGSADTV